MKILLMCNCLWRNFFSACTKTDVKPSSNSTYQQIHKIILLLKTRSNYITSHPWIYQGWYFHYVDQQHKGDPQYVRGASNNLLTLILTNIFLKRTELLWNTMGYIPFPGHMEFSDSTASLFVLKR